MYFALWILRFPFDFEGGGKRVRIHQRQYSIFFGFLFILLPIIDSLFLVTNVNIPEILASIS